MITKELSINDIAEGDRVLESVFERMGISKNHWDKTLESLCLEKKIDPDFIMGVLKGFDAEESVVSQNLSEFSIDVLIDYLRKTHHYYLNTKLPQIEQTIFYLKKDFTESHPILILLSELFIKYKLILVKHIRNEEEFLFPYIDHLNQKIAAEYDFGKEFLNKYSIHKFVSDHHDPEDGLTQIREVILNHAALTEEVMPFKIFLNQIESFERDLRAHAIIEDSVLLPKAIELEKQLNILS